MAYYTARFHLVILGAVKSPLKGLPVYYLVEVKRPRFLIFISYDINLKLEKEDRNIEINRSAS